MPMQLNFMEEGKMLEQKNNGFVSGQQGEWKNLQWADTLCGRKEAFKRKTILLQYCCRCINVCAAECADPAKSGICK